MPYTNLLDHIRDERAKGVSEEDIKKELTEHGWSSADIGFAFARAFSQQEEDKESVPIKVTSPTPSVPQEAAAEEVTKNPEPSPYISEKKFPIAPLAIILIILAILIGGGAAFLN